MASIFISYRRGEASHAVDRLAWDLDARLGPGCVYQDTSAAEAGEDFWCRIREEIGEARVVLVVVTRDWFEGLRTPANYSRRELELARDREAHLIPVFLHHSPAWPPEVSLEPDVRRLVEPLRTLNWMLVRPGPDYHGDLERLAEHVGAVVERAPRVGARSDPLVERAVDRCREVLLARRFPQAVACLERVLAANRLAPRANMYHAVACVAGRSLRTLSPRDAEEVADALALAGDAADPVMAATAAWLLIVLKHDYYFQNGLPTVPSFAELAAAFGPTERALADRGLIGLVVHSERVRRILEAA